MTTITNHEQAFELLNAAHAYLNSCDDDGDLSNELSALEDAIAEAHVAFEQWQETNAFNRAERIHEMRRNGAHLRADILESREMVL